MIVFSLVKLDYVAKDKITAQYSIFGRIKDIKSSRSEFLSDPKLVPLSILIQFKSLEWGLYDCKVFTLHNLDISDTLNATHSYNTYRLALN